MKKTIRIVLGLNRTSCSFLGRKPTVLFFEIIFSEEYPVSLWLNRLPSSDGSPRAMFNRSAYCLLASLSNKTLPVALCMLRLLVFCRRHSKLLEKITSEGGLRIIAHHVRYFINLVITLR